jgi:hypothetical protein
VEIGWPAGSQAVTIASLGDQQMTEHVTTIGMDAP